MPCLIFALLVLGGSVIADVAIGGGGWATSNDAGVDSTLVYTADAGSDRLLLLTVSFEDNTGTQATLDSIKFAAVKATEGPIVFWYDINPTRVLGIYIYYIKETGITAGSQTMMVHWTPGGSGPPQDNEQVLSIVTLTGVDQSTPISDSDSASAAAGNATITNSVSGAAGAMTVHYSGMNNGGGAWTQNNGASEGYDLSSNGGSSQFSVGYKLNHSTPSATVTGVATNRPLGMSSLVIAAEGVAAANTSYVRRIKEGEGK